ncbi:MAG TPA: hypothetical protein VM120_22500 [Bryobacteraceae bacterium]|nr:hypothetical protein [Bryobacteraceae bacterium]
MIHILTAIVLLLQPALAQQKETADALFHRGLEFARQARYGDAEQVFQLGRSLYPQDKRFPVELAGVAFRRKDRGAARAYLQKALRIDPKDGYANDFLANLYLLNSNLDAALKYWNRISKPLIQAVTLEPIPALDALLRERAITISGGQIFTRSRLHSTEANLDRLDIFTSRRFQLAPRPDQRFDLTLRLTEASAPFSGWFGRVLPFARGLPYQTVFFDRYNLSRRAINLNFLGRWDSNKRRAAFTLAAPIRRDTRFRYRLMADARDEEWDLSSTAESDALDRLRLRKLEAGGEVLFTLPHALEWTTGLRVSRRLTDQHGASIFQNAWAFSQHNELSSRFYPWPEHRIQFDARTILDTGRVFAARGTRYAKTQGSLSGVWHPQAKDEIWAIRAQLRGGYTIGALPFDEYFQLGVERDNPLWLRGHAGSRDGRKGRAPLGTRYGLMQTEVDRMVFRRPFLTVKAGPFFDGGWIADPAKVFRSYGWMPDAGLQAKVVTLGGFTWSVTYGRNLKEGGGVFYTAVQR